MYKKEAENDKLNAEKVIIKIFETGFNRNFERLNRFQDLDLSN